MVREEYLEKVKDIMIHNNSYGKYHKQNFDAYNYLGEMAPINSDIITDMPNAQIVLSEEIYTFLLAIQDVTNSLNVELPFFLYGNETSNNTIEFSDCISDSSSNSRQSDEVHYSKKMVSDLEKRISENSSGGFVVCHGHSHPPIGNFHQNFSLGDFASYIQMNQENKVFRERQVELTGCVVTTTGDINFVFYDNINDNFYRFTNVFVKDKNNNLKPVNCYKMNQAQNSNGIYL